MMKPFYTLFSTALFCVSGHQAIAQAGTIDPDYNSGTGANNDIWTMEILPDGKLFLGGAFTEFQFASLNRVARADVDGTADFSFFSSGANQDVFSSALQPDGKIILGGVFANFAGTSRLRLARANTNGTNDASFVVGTGADGAIRDIKVLPDNRILITGNVTSYNGNPCGRIARLLPDGTFDDTFDIGTGFNSPSYCLALQNDGKIMVGGFFINFNGVSRNRIARLNENGSLDETFDPGTGASAIVRDIVILPDGKILIAGQFTSYNGVEVNHIARLLPDGSLDTTFNAGTGFSSDVYSLALQSDGKIIAGGDFTSVNGINANRIARLLPDGSVDESFNTGSGASARVRQVALQPDGKIVVAGDFTTFNGETHNRYVRLLGDNLDCNGVENGSAFFDECGECVGGDTGLDPCFGGCINPEACNYDAEAGFDDGSCVLIGDPCDDGDPETSNTIILADCECGEDLATSTSRYASTNEWIAYPNPARDMLVIEGTIHQPVLMQMFDARGRLIQSEHFTHRLELNTSSLTQGLYFVNLHHDGSVERIKVVLAK
ncbi:MAG: T9SS C-terminal target domain-containing protein [Cryomorphaceae bacterium]|nr:MAG: T9SS C-terminal target domain-containing protein [Cryomorphaceae bacterium]